MLEAVILNVTQRCSVERIEAGQKNSQGRVLQVDSTALRVLTMVLYMFSMQKCIQNYDETHQIWYVQYTAMKDDHFNVEYTAVVTNMCCGIENP